jgi:lysophospholipid acyltransferase (LPLAT)-like uncharacterized protein
VVAFVYRPASWDRREIDLPPLDLRIVAVEVPLWSHQEKPTELMPEVRYGAQLQTTATVKRLTE